MSMFKSMLGVGQCFYKFPGSFVQYDPKEDEIKTEVILTINVIDDVTAIHKEFDPGESKECLCFEVKKKDASVVQIRVYPKDESSDKISQNDFLGMEFERQNFIKAAKVFENRFRPLD